MCLTGSNLLGFDTGSGPLVCMRCTTSCLIGFLKSGASINDGKSFKRSANVLLLKAKSFGDTMSTLAMLAFVVILVTGSMSRLLRTSSNKPYRFKKSAPIIGWLTAASIKVCAKVLRKPKETCKSLTPYVAIDVPFAAINVSLVLAKAPKQEFGITDTSAPVSIRNVKRVSSSHTKRRQELEWHVADPATSADSTRFLALDLTQNYMAESTS